jgi:hypothetical protein
MIDLGRIQKRLNDDPRYRDEFLRDPVGVLQREGLAVPIEMQTKLRQQVAQLTPKQASVGGAAFGPGGGPRIPKLELVLAISPTPW